MLFYTQEFAFITLPDSMTTGSSIMPQKRNPDVLELVRGATATLQAALLEIMNIPAKLGSGYQRDLQRIKPPLIPGHRPDRRLLRNHDAADRRRRIHSGEHRAG